MRWIAQLYRRINRRINKRRTWHTAALQKNCDVISALLMSETHRNEEGGILLDIKCLHEFLLYLPPTCSWMLWTSRERWAVCSEHASGNSLASSSEMPHILLNIEENHNISRNYIAFRSLAKWILIPVAIFGVTSRQKTDRPSRLNSRAFQEWRLLGCYTVWLL
jgi:hypothetical protein